MGSGIAGTLVRSGMETCVYDVDSERVKRLVQAGASGALDAADACARCDTILLSLPSSHVTVEVLERDVLPHARPHTVVIDMGTTIVRETRRLAAACKEKGVALLDAPVSGGSTGAANGTLYIFVGGERQAAESRWPILEKLGGGRLTWCGESGSGQVAKGVNQLCMGLVDAAYLEAIAYGVNGGVDAKTLAEAVGGDSGFRDHLRRLADRVAAGEGDGNDVKYAEFGYFLDFSREQGFPTPMLKALNSFMRHYPETARDNMDRPYPPLWSALSGGSR